MGRTRDLIVKVNSALLEGAGIARVIEVEVLELDGDLTVCARVDLPAEASMREVSAILYQAKRRVEAALPEVRTVYLEPDVWVDPDAALPTTSAVVMLGLD